MRSAMFIGAVAAVGLLGGCETGPGYGPRPAVVAEVGYDGYYDGFYGPIYDGYWRGGSFWWRDRDDHPFRRDDAGHFRREAKEGFNHITGVRHEERREERKEDKH